MPHKLLLWLKGEVTTPLPGKLEVDTKYGRIVGPAMLQYNTPWPCPNGQWGSGAIKGAIMHTMVGNLPGTVNWFNLTDAQGNPVAKASAHFGIGQLGLIHQFGPIGKGWAAWAEVAGNMDWYSIEHADNGNPDIPLTYKQMVASAQLLECLSRFAGFPLQVTDSVDGKGYGTHAMGGAAWGGHTCPDLPPRHVRSLQREAIVEMARKIRTPPVPEQYVQLTAPGKLGATQLAARAGVNVGNLLNASEDKLTGTSLEDFEDAVAGNLPKGMTYWVKKG